MTDEQLAAKIEEHAKHGSHAYPALLYAATERLYAFSAKCALLGASLAQAEREVDAVATSEPFGYFRALPMGWEGWEDCAETDEGAIPLYERPQPVASAAPECSASEDGIQTSEPRAWAHFVKNGNIRIWSSSAKESVRIAKENGIELTPLYTEPQPDRVAELEAEVERLRTQVATEHAVARVAVCARIDAENELREARAWIAMVHEWFGRESSIIYELSESIRVDIAQAAAAEREACADLVQGWNTAMTDKLADAIRARGEKGGE